MLCLIAAAHEGRDVATADVRGAYLHAEMDDFVVVKLQGKIVDILCDRNPSYRKFVVQEKGGATLYMQLLKALYGCIKSALLWYELFSGTLIGMGFELNPYDNCVANKKIEDKQCTIAWWVDDNFMSHMKPEVLTKVIEDIEAKFGKMSVTRGDEHVFLGIKIRFPRDGTVGIKVDNYLRDAFDAFGEPLTRKVATPALKDLLNIDMSSPRLSDDRAARFRRVVGILQWACKRGRPDVDLPIAFLRSRVDFCTEQDWKKLRRLLLFLQDTIDDERIIGAADLRELFTYIDASHAVHDNMRGHTGGLMSFGRGVFHSRSTKQRINTGSSTESEVVGVHEYLPYNIWVQNFMEAQGYKLKSNVIYQDNQSAIKMETNGRASCSDRSRHINIRYFFVKDYVKRNKIDIQYCPTEEMLADFYTKPLQGSLFRKFRAIIMGWKPLSALQDLGEFKERVANVNSSEKKENP